MNPYDRISLLRKGKGITWKYLNEKVDGAYHGRMTDLKNGKTTLSVAQLATVAEILETSTDYLLGNTDDPSPAGQKEKPPAQGGEPLHTIDDWERAIDDMTQEERKTVMELLMKKFMEDGK